jgi:tetratricopeptide (TPR) repeat protein/transcriptional regulator with XRE-family HTH domain
MTAFVPNDTFREIRRKKGSRQQLAALLETSTTNIVRWERGEAWPEPAMLHRLCELFAMSPNELGFSETVLPQQQGIVQQGSAGINPDSASIGPVYDSAVPLLPAAPLVGRTRELFQVKERLKRSTGSTATVLTGLPGVGKTALAITLAHDSDLRAHFRDGILWSNLGLAPPLLAVLRRWGSLLGISGLGQGQSLHPATLNDVSSLSTALRIAIENRRMLLVIDDACKLEDALTLCIGGPHCAYLVTTRFAHIATRVASGGTVQLQELHEEESIELLRLLAPRVVDAEPDRVRELVGSVGGLPLALMLMGNYLRTQTTNKLPRRITATLERLSQSHERLQVHEPHPPVEKHPDLPDGALLSLQSAIAVSDQLLYPSSRAALYALSIFPPKPQSFSEEAALTVALCTHEDLDNLCDAGIVEYHGDRYMLHRVIADYARLQLRGQAERDAIERLATYVAQYVETNRKDYDLLEVESSTIRTTLALAHSYDHWGMLVSITCSFVPFLMMRGLYGEAEEHLQRAYAVADGSGQAQPLRDSYAYIQLLFYLGEVAQKRGQLAQAETHLQRGLEYARSIRHSEYTGDLLKSLGWVASKRGDYAQAHVYLQESLQLARQGGDHERLCSILSIFGSVLATEGEYRQANSYLSEGLALARRMRDYQQTCSLLINKGVIYGTLGDFQHAEEAFHEGLFHARQLRHREWISLLLINLGDIAHEHNDYDLAEKYLHEGLAMVREMGHRELLCVALINLAVLARKRENYVQAHAYLEESLALSYQVEQPEATACVLYEYAELHFDLQLVQEANELFLAMRRISPPGNQKLFALAQYGLARTLVAQGNLFEAREVGTESAEIFAAMQHRKAQEVRLWVEDLNRALNP